MTMDVMLEKGAKMPTRAFETDAGLDLYALHGGVVRAHSSATFRTGVHVELPKGTAGIILPRSGLMVNRNLVSFGVIDESYRGEIMVHLFNHDGEDYLVHEGDKISQMLVISVMYLGVNLTDALGDGARGANGFGSTGR